MGKSSKWDAKITERSLGITKDDILSMLKDIETQDAIDIISEAICCDTEIENAIKKMFEDWKK